MKVRLSNEERRYLFQARFLSAEDLAVVTRDDGFGSVELTRDEADRIRDVFGEQLQRVGLDADYKATTDGAMLEQLID